MKRIDILLILLIALFVLARITVLTSDRFYAFKNWHISDGQKAKACLSKDLFSGLVLSPMEYVYISRETGNLIVFPLFAPIYYFLGDSLFTHSFAAFLWSFATLALWVYCIRKVYNNARIACLFVLLYILPPPAFLQESLVLHCTGAQSEIFFPVLIFLLFLLLTYYALNTQESRKKVRLTILALGSLCGVGLFYHILFLMVMPIIVFYIITCLRRKIKVWDILLLSIGLITFYSFRGYFSYSQSCLGDNPSIWLGNRLSIIPHDIFTVSWFSESFSIASRMIPVGIAIAMNSYYGHPINREEHFLAAGYAWTLFFIFVYLIIVHRTSFSRILFNKGNTEKIEDFKNSVPLLLPISFIICYSFSGLRNYGPFQLNRLYLLYIFLILLVAIALNNMMRKGRLGKLISIFILVFMVGYAALLNVNTLVATRTGLGKQKRGTDYKVIAYKLYYKIFYMHKTADNNLLAVLAKADKFDRTVLAVTIGDLPWSHFFDRLVNPNTRDKDVNEIIATIRTTCPEFQPFFWRGLGRLWIFSGKSIGEIRERFGNALSDEEMVNAFRGAGAMSAFLSEIVVSNPPSREQIILLGAEIEKAEELILLPGYEKRSIERDLEVWRREAPSFVEGYPNKLQGAFCTGWLDYLLWEHDGDAWIKTALEDARRMGIPCDDPNEYFLLPATEGYF